MGRHLGQIWRHRSGASQMAAAEQRRIERVHAAQMQVQPHFHSNAAHDWPAIAVSEIHRHSVRN